MNDDKFAQHDRSFGLASPLPGQDFYEHVHDYPCFSSRHSRDSIPIRCKFSQSVSAFLIYDKVQLSWRMDIYIFFKMTKFH